MPKGVKIRPTQDRVREAIFNIIREGVPGSRVLDLYAGSGAFGIEAISRGARSAVFVDDNAKCIATIDSNMQFIEDREKTTQVIKKDGLRAIDALVKKGDRFDIVFMDPPYYRDMAKNTLIKIGACDILSKRGFVVAEHSSKDTIAYNIGTLSMFKRSQYGDTVVSFFKESIK